VAEKLREVASRALDLAEKARSAADQARRGHEKSFETATQLEQNVENERLLAEQLRRESEGLREDAELLRQRNEAHRIRAELRRDASEESRRLGEDIRRRLGVRESEHEREQAPARSPGDEISPALRRAIRDEVRSALVLLRTQNGAVGHRAPRSDRRRR
jgi:hypothetical protein